MIPIVVQPEVMKELADCIIDVIQNKIDWNSIDWQAVAENQRKNDWIPVSERLPEENLPCCNYGFDFKAVLCTTIWGDVRAYKFGKPIGHDKPHFWLGGGIMDKYVIAWQPLPEPYKKGGAE